MSAVPDPHPIELLKTHHAYPSIIAKLDALPWWDASNDVWLGMAICRGLEGPRPHEKLTRSNRHKVADRITAVCNELAELLFAVHGSRETFRQWPFEFQALIDRFSLSAAIDYRDSVGPADDSELGAALSDDEGNAFHSARYAIYHTMIDCMPEALRNLSDAAQHWKESDDQPLAKPNHRNANRLYFIRELTRHFVAVSGKPAREITLALTSVYFECGDIDEAALSNLAPVTEKMRKLYEARKKFQVAKA